MRTNTEPEKERDTRPPCSHCGGSCREPNQVPPPPREPTLCSGGHGCVHCYDSYEKKKLEYWPFWACSRCAGSGKASTPVERADYIEQCARTEARIRETDRKHGRQYVPPPPIYSPPGGGSR